MHVTGVRDDLRDRDGDPEQPSPIGRDDRGGDRLDHPGDLVDLGEDPVPDLGERCSLRVEQEVPVPDRGDDPLDPRLRGQAGEGLRHRARCDADVDVRIHRPQGNVGQVSVREDQAKSSISARKPSRRRTGSKLPSTSKKQSRFIRNTWLPATI